MLGVVTPVPYVVTVLLALGARHRRSASAPGVGPGAGPWSQPGCIALVLVADAISCDRRRDRRRDLVGGDRPPARSLRRRRPRGRRGLLVADAASRRAHLLLGPGRHPAGRHHARPQRRASRTSSSSSTSSATSGSSLAAALPRRRAADRAPTRIGGPHVRDHARATPPSSASSTRSSGANYMFLRTPAGQLDPAQGPRSVAVVHRQRRRRCARAARRAGPALLDQRAATMAEPAQARSAEAARLAAAPPRLARAGGGGRGAVGRGGGFRTVRGRRGARRRRQALRPRHPRRDDRRAGRPVGNPARDRAGRSPPCLPRRPAARRAGRPVRAAPDDARHVRGRARAHRRVGHQPDLLVVRGDLRPRPAAAQRHVRRGAGRPPPSRRRRRSEPRRSRSSPPATGSGRG